MVIKKLFRFAFSAKFAIYLMVTIFLYIFFGVYSGNLLARPYQAWWFILLQVVLAANILGCTIYRFRRQTGAAIFNVPWEHRTMVKRSFNLKELSTLLLSRNFKTESHGDVILAQKNPHSRLGSMIFHLGLVIVLGGFAVSAIWGVRGIVLAPEKVQINLAGDFEITRKGIFFDRDTGFQAVVKEIRPIVKDDIVEQVKSTIVFFRNGETVEQEMEINRPAIYRGYSWRSNNWGYSPFLVIKDEKGELLHNNFVNIATHNGRSFYDNITLKNGLNLRVEFIDFTAETGNGSLSILPNNPAVMITKYNGGKKAAEDIIQLGKEKDINGLRFAFTDYRMWELFDVSYDPGGIFIYLGGFCATVGIAWRGLFIRKRIWLKLEDEPDGQALFWTSRADYFNDLFREEVSQMLRDFQRGAA
ncbi:MAG: cytochrome c biogenesis protein ResB [Bacillota bacterium]